MAKMSTQSFDPTPYYPSYVSDLRQSRRLAKGGTAQSGSAVSRRQAAPLTTGPSDPDGDLPPRACGYTRGSPPHLCPRWRHSTPEPRNGARYRGVTIIGANMCCSAYLFICGV